MEFGVPTKMVAEEAGGFLLQLDDNCLINILASCDSHKDVVNASRTCRRLRVLSSSNTIWNLRIQADLSTTLLACPSEFAFHLYRRVFSAENQAVLTFAGCYTDGGCDEPAVLNWVDNMFSTTPRCSYRSASGSRNIHCVGVLQDSTKKLPEAAKSHREFLIDRCKWGASCLLPEDELVDPADLLPYPVPLFTAAAMLAKCSTAGLEDLFIHMVHEMNALNNWGRNLLRCCENDIDAHQVYHNYWAIIQAAQVSRCLPSDIVVEKDRRRPSQQYSPKLWDDACAEHELGFFGDLLINRQQPGTAQRGSLAVQCGAVFSAVLRPATPFGKAVVQQTASPIDLCADNAMLHMLSDRLSADSVFEAVAEGLLPRVVRYAKTFSGEWIEFEPMPIGSGLQPVIWFRFHDVAARQNNGVGVVPSASSSIEAASSSFEESDIASSLRPSSSRGLCIIPPSPDVDVRGSLIVEESQTSIHAMSPSSLLSPRPVPHIIYSLPAENGSVQVYSPPSCCPPGDLTPSTAAAAADVAADVRSAVQSAAEFLDLPCDWGDGPSGPLDVARVMGLDQDVLADFGLPNPSDASGCADEATLPRLMIPEIIPPQAECCPVSPNIVAYAPEVGFSLGWQPQETLSHMLAVPLLRRRPANVLCVKLIAPEGTAKPGEAWDAAGAAMDCCSVMARGVHVQVPTSILLG